MVNDSAAASPSSSGLVSQHAAAGPADRLVSVFVGVWRKLSRKEPRSSHDAQAAEAAVGDA